MTQQTIHTADYEARRIQILRAAAGLFRRQGFAATRIEDIADAVQLTKAGLYHYIRTKEQLLQSILDHALQRLDWDVIGPSLEEADPEARLRLMIRRNARLMIEEPDLLSILFEEADRVAPRIGRQLATRQRQYFELLRETCLQLEAAGRLRIDSTVATFNLLGSVYWLPRWFSPGGRLTRDQVVAQTTQAFLAGILVSEPDDSEMEMPHAAVA